MLLEAKTAIVYGAGGAIGSAVARAYAREGATVHLAGRTRSTLEDVAGRIRHDGGTAYAAQVDALDRAAVERHADGVAAGGGIDICFNATSNDDVQGTPLLAMPFEEFLRPVTKAVTAHFNAAVAVGRHMTPRGRGVILVMAGGREAIPRLGGSHVAWAALAGLCRQLAAEFGPYGVRVSWLLSPGSPGYDDHDGQPDGAAAPGTEAAPGTVGLLTGHLPSYGEVANIAVFAASDWARTITASEINFTGGAVVD
jgi:NAD(P)-dependent dehydrogenase (short-subunit alcohol dehydrogenase family)